MQLDPETYHYIFEKYLRAELGQSELEMFEEKLIQDTDFNSQFQQYKLHRAEILKRELAAYEAPIIANKSPKNLGWLYLIVSILGIVLVLDNYFNKKNHDSLNPPKNIISRSIGLFKPGKKAGQTDKLAKLNAYAQTGESAELIIPSDSSVDNRLMEQDSFSISEQQYLEKVPLQLEDEVFVADSIFECYPYSVWNDLLESVSYEVDSVLSDSTMMLRSVLLLSKKKQLKVQPLLVEYWQSAYPFKGYVFDGSKLMLYGLPTQTIFYLLFDEEKAIYFIIQNARIFQLTQNKHLQRIPIQ